ncbi:MAG TPA: type II toxin-antitoxin system RelE/ParE family toxin [Candidatus Krumholzibacterium sp.]|nr:type II toxin-antitoxin system RelE/ParE family toxin [Candidatus Krumholzibacterium sp.]
MARYRILIKASAAKELENIGSQKDRRRIVKRIAGLADDPRPAGCEKLSGKDRYRIRQGDYRIIYSIEDDILIVHIVRIGNRKDIYRRDK